MKFLYNLIFSCLIATLFTSCGNKVTSLTQDDVQSLDSLVVQLRESIRKKDTSLIRKFTVDTIRVMYPNRPASKRVKAFAGFIKSSKWLNFNIGKLSIEGNNEFAVIQAPIGFQVKAGKPPRNIPHRGDILLVARKNEDGTWLLTHLSYSSFLKNPPQKKPATKPVAKK